MKGIIKKLIILALVGVAVLAGLLFAYSKTRGGAEDLKHLEEHAKLVLFRHGLIKTLSQRESYRLYEKKCYRKCHGEAVMITAILPPSGWMQIVERMRVQQDVAMTGKEAGAIIRYLELRYPSHKSSVPYQIRRKINRLLWKNDIGYGDLYVDVIYGTKVYFDSINASNLAEEYGIHDNLVFLMSLTVHDGKVKHYPIERMSVLQVGEREFTPMSKWWLRFETADGHHYEGILRFLRKDASGKDIINPDTKSMKLVIKNMETTEDRVYQWDFPILYPKEYDKIL